jgi:short subunit fatty acids transporter
MDIISAAIAIPIFIDIAEPQTAFTIERNNQPQITNETIPQLSSVFKKIQRRRGCGYTLCVVLALIFAITICVMLLLPKSDSVVGTVSKYIKETFEHLSEMRP